MSRYGSQGVQYHHLKGHAAIINIPKTLISSLFLPFPSSLFPKQFTPSDGPEECRRIIFKTSFWGFDFWSTPQTAVTCWYIFSKVDSNLSQHERWRSSWGEPLHVQDHSEKSLLLSNCRCGGESGSNLRTTALCMILDADPCTVSSKRSRKGLRKQPSFSCAFDVVPIPSNRCGNAHSFLNEACDSVSARLTSTFREQCVTCLALHFSCVSPEEERTASDQSWLVDGLLWHRMWGHNLSRAWNNSIMILLPVLDEVVGLRK